MKPKYKLKVTYLSSGEYFFELEEGVSSQLYFVIEENDSLTIHFDNTSYDYEKTVERRLNVIYNNFFKEIIPEIPKEKLEEGYIIVDGLFKRVEQYIINHDIKVDYQKVPKEDEKLDLEDENPPYKIVYDKETGKISYYFKDYRLEDEAGIIINPDGSYFPCYSVKHAELKQEEKNFRKQIIKEFIYNKLKIKIEFGINSDIAVNADKTPLTIKDLYKKAYTDYEKSNPSIKPLYSDAEDKPIKKY